MALAKVPPGLGMEGTCEPLDVGWLSSVAGEPYDFGRGRLSVTRSTVSDWVDGVG